ncbi:hydroxymethylglutaryl-CoA lyase [Halobacillus karajensis]|uniref:Hydroxymethylglutaryl-CoA lyase YngG n=1 Tax=Halobacillus karajensis TaxID=195088 RepID=A0A024P369_9BACI|nr:hydroxymethylglutaryl-CoA lyase [Halobacillus karajensis]CDQ19607.1 Hydroxymethylglutaryl-CoA lyase YngG [Halobacillus karajensis]CDQ22067.1 Hydroxymethylglutaryl-CoA lyase YngG [Halobacillus karajensis]CDQ27908.1 Hydroxymethylglutaryl-CoA lyase YngG [Halobacillus karajensis]SEH79612.1 hydroxymethylglutaryl-CoA lyase [Halobacillus karajensis]
MQWPEKVTIKEVGPRDGLQNESGEVPLEDKVSWIDLLSEAGFSYIEFSSFVHPKWIPQLKDSRAVAERIKRKRGVTYAALVPNRRGLEAAVDTQVDEVSVFMSASETHNKKNINKSIEDTFPVLEEVVREAKLEGKSVRGYLSTVFGCPYEGNISTENVARISERLFEMGINELSLGDTIGVANPEQVDRALNKWKQWLPFDHLAMHFHNTRGMALANVLVSLQHNITTYDSAVGGLGGCPYAKGASGNLATDDLVHMLHQMGIETGIDERKLEEAALYIQQVLNKPLPSHQMQVINKERV